MFSDGIRPGGDLTELDGRPEGHRWDERNNKYILNASVSELWVEDPEEEAGDAEHGDSLEVRIM